MKKLAVTKKIDTPPGIRDGGAELIHHSELFMDLKSIDDGSAYLYDSLPNCQKELRRKCQTAHPSQFPR
jgi:hypothetical protein